MLKVMLFLLLVICKEYCDRERVARIVQRLRSRQKLHIEQPVVPGIVRYSSGFL